MPLHDYFRPPLLEECPFVSFHSAWANVLVVQLNRGILPKHFRALPQLHMGTQVEIDVATFQEIDHGTTSANGVAGASWSPSDAILSASVDFADRDTFEVKVQDQLSRRLVAAIELVSPGNKDRPHHRRDFVVKCASYLQHGIALVIVDAVTSRRANLHLELMQFLDMPQAMADAGGFPLYAVAYRLKVQDNDEKRLELWAQSLEVAAPLPTLPLWLGPDLAVPLNLETSYQAARQALRLEN